MTSINDQPEIVFPWIIRKKFSHTPESKILRHIGSDGFSVSNQISGS